MSIIDTIVFLIFTGGVVLLGCSFFKKKQSFFCNRLVDKT